MSEERATLSSLRAMAMVSGGYHNADTLHNVWHDYGYPAELEFSHFWHMFHRCGIAENVVVSIPDMCWSTPPIVNGIDPYFETLAKEMKLWQRLRAVDTRQRLGRYAGLFMRVRDNMTPDEPLQPGNVLFSIMPLYESQLKVIKTDRDIMSDTFEQPIMLEYDTTAYGARSGDVADRIKIHASRVIFASEGADDGGIYGKPAMGSIFNALMDIVKIIGGGAEGFYKNAAQSLVLDVKDTASALANAEKLDEFSEQSDDFMRNRTRRILWTPGMEATTLESNLASPKEHFNACMTEIAAGSGIPASILQRQQVGRQAGDDDSDQFKATCQSRREDFGNELVDSVIDWLVKNRSIKKSNYEIEWDDLRDSSKAEKLANGKVMIDMNVGQYQSGGRAIFDDNEVREECGYDPESEEERPEAEARPDAAEQEPKQDEAPVKAKAA